MGSPSGKFSTGVAAKNWPTFGKKKVSSVLVFSIPRSRSVDIKYKRTTSPVTWINIGFTEPRSPLFCYIFAASWMALLHLKSGLEIMERKMYRPFPNSRPRNPKGTRLFYKHIYIYIRSRGPFIIPWELQEGYILCHLYTRSISGNEGLKRSTFTFSSCL